MAEADKKVHMATIGAPHGVRGEVRVRTFTGDPMALGDYGPLADEKGRKFAVLDIRPAKTVVVVRFKGVDSREKAEALNGVELFVDRAVLPDEDLDEDEFFHEDLVGLKVVDAAGAPRGTVIAVHDFGGGDILEIGGRGKKSVMIPFSQAAVPVIDFDAGQITVEPVAAGLAESGDEDEEPGA